MSNTSINSPIKVGGSSMFQTVDMSKPENDHGHGNDDDGIYYSMTSKTIAPLPYNLPPPDLRRRREINETSAWTPGNIYVRDFSTQQEDSFMNPKVYTSHIDAHEESLEKERKEWENKRNVERNDALQKLYGVAKLKYGSMANMLRAFKKNTGDTITLPEFAEHLRRRNMDSMLPLEDQELVWEQLKSTARGSVAVSSLSKAVEESSKGDEEYSKYSQEKRDMIELRNFLAEEVKRKREESGQGNDIDRSGRGGADITGPDGEDKVKKALGSKTFDLDIGAEEMDNVVEGLFQKKHTKDSHEKFSRFLRLTNVNLHAIPFYDMRTEEVARLKSNARRLGLEMSDPALTTKLSELQDLSKTRILDDIISSRKFKAEAEYKMTQKYLPFTNMTSPIKATRTRQGSGLSGSVSMSALPTSNRSNNNNYGNSGGGSHVPLTFSAREGQQWENNDNSSWTQTLSPSRSTTYITPEPDSTAAALGGEMDPSMYNSTYSEYYPPLNYEPNKPITRNNISDADAKYKLKLERRQLRQKRTETNMKLTKDRLDLEKLHTLNKQLKGEHSRTEDMIRYQTTVFLHDLKAYKKQPLQTMAKKPNLTKSDAMWGGSQKFDDANTNNRDNRDFGTTFRNSFIEPPPQTEPLINLEDRVNKMFSTLNGR
jgi:hypothetical protein